MPGKKAPPPYVPEAWEHPDMQFKYLVLQGLWVIIRLLWSIRLQQGGPGCNAESGTVHLRSNLLLWLDKNGRPGADPAEYRRTTLHPDLRGR